MKIYKGVVVIPAILFMGGLVIVISFSGFLVSYLLGSGNYGIRLSFQALAAAQAGVEDAVLRIVRNHQLMITCNLPDFNLTLGSNKTCVTIGGDLPVAAGIVQKKIVSQGFSLTRYRQLEALVQIDENRGEVKVLSVQETALP